MFFYSICLSFVHDIVVAIGGEDLLQFFGSEDPEWILHLCVHEFIYKKVRSDVISISSPQRISSHRWHAKDD
jgi:hypothetical protein